MPATLPHVSLAVMATILIQAVLANHVKLSVEHAPTTSTVNNKSTLSPLPYLKYLKPPTTLPLVTLDAELVPSLTLPSAPSAVMATI